MAPQPVIVAGARTGIGRLLGALSGCSAVDLAAAAIAGALERAGTPSTAVESVVLGQVLPAGAGQLPPRQAAAQAGIPMSVPALGVSQVCLSGMASIATAAMQISSGQVQTAVAGGMESMSSAPHLLPGARAGYRYGDRQVVDHLAHDGLWDAFTAQSMGALTEQANAGAGPEAWSREAQDGYAAASHQRAAAAWRAGRFADEVVPTPLPDGRVFAADEGIRPETTAGQLARLRPAFAASGTITAGSASQLSDGACALVVQSRAAAERAGQPIVAEILGAATVAGPDSSLQHQPAQAVRAACERAGVRLAELDLLEINEAFAAVVLASARALGVDLDRVNVNGGAIALGHPIGASGARITLHLALELARRGGGLGAAALCGGGGQGCAIVLRVPPR